MPMPRSLLIVMVAMLVFGCTKPPPVPVVDGSTLANADCNQDGRLDRGEVGQFRQFFSGFPGEIIGEGPFDDWQFSEADLSRDGFLDLPELQKLLLKAGAGWRFVQRCS